MCFRYNLLSRRDSKPTPGDELMGQFHRYCKKGRCYRVIKKVTKEYFL